MLLSLDPETNGQVRAVFKLGGPRQTQVEVVIKISGHEDHADEALREVWRLIENTRYAVRPHSCLECDWHDLMALIERCHREAQALSARVSMTLNIEDTVPAPIAIGASLAAAATPGLIH